MSLPPQVFQTLPELLTPTLRLRALTTADLPTVWPITYYHGQPAGSQAEAERMLARIEQDYRAGQLLHWAVALAATDEPVGTCGFYRGFAGRSGEIGYVLHPAHRGRGLMTEAVGAMCAFGFGTLQLRRIVADTADYNQASQRVLTHNGFRPIGLVGQWQRYELLPPRP
ncbi:GNAT family protein [Hymenobacter coalescens]